MLSFQNQGDNDLIYFTNLLAWRCGTASILYGLNDDPPTTLFPAEPCYREFREPNVLQHVGEPGFPFFLTVPEELGAEDHHPCALRRRQDGRVRVREGKEPDALTAQLGVKRSERHDIPPSSLAHSLLPISVSLKPAATSQ